MQEGRGAERERREGEEERWGRRVKWETSEGKTK
jgi:hypothetical protein